VGIETSGNGTTELEMLCLIFSNWNVGGSMEEISFNTHRTGK